MLAPAFHVAPAEAAGCALPRPVEGEVALDPSCTYRKTVTINARGTTLDCRGATIDASGRSYGILVRADRVTIRNCRIENAERNGIMLRSRIPDGRKVALPLDERYIRSPRGTVIEDVTVVDAENVGIFVGSYVSDTTILRATVRSAGGPGIYLDQASRRTTLEDGTIEDNGWGTWSKPRFLTFTYRREGLAVDSSADNVIRRNRFAGNGGGGIFLYKNCHEFAATKKNSVPRWQPSQDNLIEDNDFDRERVGIWIASRQDRDLTGMECGDPSYAPGRYLDAAPGNIVRGNRFTNVETPLRIEDDGTTVEGNDVAEGADVCLEAGTKARSEVLGRPVVGTVVTGNACPAGAAYLFTHGAVPATFEDNAEGDAPAEPLVED